MIRNRLSQNDPVNSTLQPGQQAATSNFGFQRQIEDASRTFGDQVQMLEGEKISLMKRLNMVLSELEKATHEKSDIAAKLRQQERLADELKHKLEEISGLKNVVNRNLQDDLNYERDLN
jgi:predicted RNase H-like nuclease (RuvC/YqgF family)